MVNGKAKGNAYERELCRKISLWISEGQFDDLIWRSASSGAVHTIRSKKSATKGDYRSQVGDLCSIHEMSAAFMNKFGVEAKRYGNLEYDKLICGLKSKAGTFWDTHVELCKKAEKIPLLIMKQDYRPDLVFMPTNIADKLQSGNNVRISAIGASIYVLDDFLAATSHSQMLSA